MNGNSKDYQIAKAQMARTQHKAQQHQRAAEMTTASGPNIIKRMVTEIWNRPNTQTIPTTVMTTAKHTRYA